MDPATRKLMQKIATSGRRPAATRRAPRGDGQSILVSAYFEAQKVLSAAESVMAYSIAIDPKHFVIKKSDAVALKDGASPATDLVNDKVPLTKWNTFKDLFNQYRINSANITVRVDGAAGLEHPVICTTDKGDDATIASMAQAMTGAHKSYSMTSSRRELKYGCKSSGQELDFFSTKANQDMAPGETKYLKVFQKVPADPANAGVVCEHQIQVLMSLTLKDSKNVL